MWGFVPILLIWVLIGMAVLWFLCAMNNIAEGLHEISDRLVALEHAVRQTSPRGTP
jgi:hypothetical protein